MWYKFGEKRFVLEDYLMKGGVVVYEMPELDIVAKGLTFKEAADSLAWQIEVRLRETKTFTGEVWDYLRKLNGYKVE
jgi:hypothetical protein